MVPMIAISETPIWRLYLRENASWIKIYIIWKMFARMKTL
jgi:hypothetical protein